MSHNLWYNYRGQVNTTFPPARELAFGLAPSYELAEVARRQEETTEARRLLGGGSSLELSEARDLGEALQRASLGGALTGEELRHVYYTLAATRRARAAVLRQKDMPVLGEVARGLPVLRDLEEQISSAIGVSGEVLDGASPVLKGLRAEGRSAYQRLMDSLERMVRRSQRDGILQEPIITQRNGRMVLLVKTEMKHRLPGIVHDVSDSGATLFVEPMAAVGLGNSWRELRLAEQREEEKVVRSLSAKVEAHSDELFLGGELLARLDLAMAKGRYASDTGAVAAALIDTERPYISLVDARHPLLEGEVVPIYADIGDQQSIKRALSTFSSHIHNLRVIMEQAGDKSLALIDELGTSTDPEEGSALAKAILQGFLDRRITVVATTHHRDVAAFVQDHPGMMNASVELDPQTLAPTYRLTLGLPGGSYALTIASSLGLETEIVEGARALLSPDHQQAESLLKELQEERHLAQERRRQAEEAKVEAETRSAELDDQLAKIQDTKAQMIDEARHELQRRVDDTAKRLRAGERALERVGSQSVSREAQNELGKVRRELRSPTWQAPPSRRHDWLKQLQPGDRVYLRGMPQAVEVIAPPGDGDTAEVLLGTMRARVPAYQLDRPAPVHILPFRDGVYYSRPVKPESTEGRPWGQPLKKPAGAPLNLG